MKVRNAKALKRCLTAYCTSGALSIILQVSC